MTVSIDNARQGMVTEQNVYKNDTDRVPLLFGGTVLNVKLIENLKRLGINSIDVIFENDIEETISTTLKKVSAQSLKNFNMKDTILNAEEIVNKILNTKYISYSLIKYLYQNDDIYEQAVNVCEYAVAIGKGYNESRSIQDRINLNDLALAALLHNIGKMCANKEILSKMVPIRIDRNKFKGFDSDCFAKYNQNMHIIYAYSFLKDNPLISQSVRTAILFSQENEKGTGTLQASPEFTSRKEPSMVMAKIIHIAAMYNELLARVIKKTGKDRKESPNNVIDILEYARKNNLISNELTNIFFRTIPLYSIGTRVVLTDGSLATVVDINETSLDKPCVQLDSTGMMLDLSGITNVSVSCLSDYDLQSN